MDELDHEHDHEHEHDHAHEIAPEDDLPVLKDVARLDNCVTVIDACNFDATFNTGFGLSS